MVTILAVALCQGPPPAPPPRKPVVAIVVAEDEYQTETTLPAFAKTHLPGWEAVTIAADPKTKHHLPKLAEVRRADVILLSVRRRPLVEADLAIVKAAIAGRTPLVAIRTSSHAFAPKKGETLPPGVAAWESFDKDILGCSYTGHHSNKLTTAVARHDKAGDHPLLKGTGTAPFTSPSWLYKSKPLADDVNPLWTGTVTGQPTEPVAWAREGTDKRGRVVYTSLGAAGDFEIPAFTTFLANAVAWVRVEK